MIIYVADDNPCALSSLVGEIKKVFPEGKIKRFRRAREVLGQMEKQPCDLLLSAIDMRDMSGMELAMQMSSRYPGTPILFVAGETASSSAEQGLVPDGCLTGPVTADKIKEKISRLSGLPVSPVIPREEILSKGDLPPDGLCAGPEKRRFPPMKKRGDLLETLWKEIGCEYLSDLKFSEYRENIKGIVARIPSESYTLFEWNDAVAYLLEEPEEFFSADQAKACLLHRLRT